MNLNKAILIGNLTRDPELKTMPDGRPVAKFSLAINHFFKDRNTGEKKSVADFVNVVVFGKPAENCASFLKKGQQAYVEGKIKTRSWDTDQGKRYSTEVVAENVQFGSRLDDSKPKYEKDESNAPPATTEGKIEYPNEDINVDDIPF